MNLRVALEIEGVLRERRHRLRSCQQRLADAVGKYPTGMKTETFLRLYKQVAKDETKTIADALLDHGDLFVIGADKTGAETVQRVQ